MYLLRRLIAHWLWLSIGLATRDLSYSDIGEASEADLFRCTSAAIVPPAMWRERGIDANSVGRIGNRSAACGLRPTAC